MTMSIRHLSKVNSFSSENATEAISCLASRLLSQDMAVPHLSKLRMQHAVDERKTQVVLGFETVRHEVSLHAEQVSHVN